MVAVAHVEKILALVMGDPSKKYSTHTFPATRVARLFVVITESSSRFECISCSYVWLFTRDCFAAPKSQQQPCEFSAAAKENSTRDLVAFS